MKLEKVRSALDYIEKTFGTSHPLAREEFQTDGIDLFLDNGELLAVSKEGQFPIRDIIQANLQRIEVDEEGIAAKFFPLTRRGHLDSPMSVVINPRIAFGQPVMAANSVPVSAVANRHLAGESINDLADDFGIDPGATEDAIRCDRMFSERAA